MDELEGQPDDLPTLFAGIARCQNLKMSVFSGPLVEFYEAFQHAPNMRLERLNSAKFNGYQSLMKLSSVGKYLTALIIDTIASEAGGVFLWVHLFVANLTTADDRVSDLQNRLEEMAPGIEELYDKITSALIKGLLDMQEAVPFGNTSDQDRFKVVYFHRIVKDYLAISRVRTALDPALKLTFDHRLRFLVGQIAYLKGLDIGHLDSYIPNYHFAKCQEYATKCLDCSQAIMHQLLDEFDKIGSISFSPPVSSQGSGTNINEENEFDCQPLWEIEL
ncbi:hypothetical protein FHL15_007943 [Xylaria flabelliformis]|uniref:Uncharacterized protein n=1 Tax=Xylaria flabelliformis TaxID=2512241 RepID=A0A553HT86_9PEZI|nr:hypothetical protein FHL15_007943 [Xylaria flabelliformis]